MHLISIFLKRGVTLQSLGTSVNGKQEESTVACVAMVYWYFKARGRTDQEAGARGVRRVETFTFHFSPSHPSFFCSLAQYLSAPHVQLQGKNCFAG